MSLSPEREKYYQTKVKSILEKNPDLDYHRVMEAVSFEAWKGMRILHIDFACAIWPFGPDPEKIDRHSKKYASEGLIHAAALGDIKGSAQWLDMGANINYQDKKGYTPLLMALSHKRLGMAEFLLQHGADANQKNKKGWTPVLKSVCIGLPLAFPILKKYGASFDTSFCAYTRQNSFPFFKRDKYYPLTFACLLVKSRNGREVVKSLLNSGANPNITFEDMPLIDWVHRRKKMKSRFWLKGQLKQAIRQRS